MCVTPGSDGAAVHSGSARGSTARAEGFLALSQIGPEHTQPSACLGLQGESLREIDPRAARVGDGEPSGARQLRSGSPSLARPVSNLTL
jgi:hypothetical protein